MTPPRTTRLASRACGSCGKEYEGRACKPCRAAYMREYYRRPGVHERWIARARDRHRRNMADPIKREIERQRGREEYVRRTRRGVKQARDPIKQAARTLLGNAVRDGRVRKPENCQECGAGGRIEGHHTDYTKPLDVMWLCTLCHGLQHRKEAA